MSQARTAKLFRNGASQAVRLPSDFRFEGREVYVSRDGSTGDVLLSTRPGAGVWSEFFQLVHSDDTASDFMTERPMNLPPAAAGLFDDEAA